MGGISLSSFLGERLVLAQEEFSFGSVRVDFIVTGHSVFEIRAERARWDMEIRKGWGLLPIVDM